MKKCFVSKVVVFLACLVSFNAFACGPTPQKVVKEITIKADAKSVWEIIDRFDAISQWSPDVQSSTLVKKMDDEGAPATFRTITFKNGSTLEEKRRTIANGQMKLDYQMSNGDFPVSNYRGVMQVKEGDVKGETIVTWTGRFNNKANTLAAPPGQDNETAINAISSFYDNSLAGLKAFAENK